VPIESYADTFDSPRSSLKAVALNPAKVEPSALFAALEDPSNILVFLVFNKPGSVTVALFGPDELL
jgi:hypothetical protein